MGFIIWQTVAKPAGTALHAAYLPSLAFDCHLFFTENFLWLSSDDMEKQLTSQGNLVSGQQVAVGRESSRSLTTKETLVHFTLFLLVYTFLNYDFGLKTNIILVEDAYFGLDQDRAFRDLTTWDADHYRTKVHPLFVLFLQPIVRSMNVVIGNSYISVMILQAVVGAAAVTLVCRYLAEIGVPFKGRTLLTLIYGVSFSQLIFTISPETYVFGGLSLIGMHYYVLRCFKSRKLSVPALVSAGVLTIAITVTNFAQFVIALHFLLKRNLPSYKHAKTIFWRIVIAVLIIASVLAGVQKVLYPSSLFFGQYLLFPDEEFEYMDAGGGVGFIAILKTVAAGDPVGAMRLAKTGFDGCKLFAEAYANLLGRGLIFGEFAAFDSTAPQVVKELRFTDFTAAQFCLTLIFNIILISAIAINYRMKDDSAYLQGIFPVLLASLVFNLALHAIYGRAEGYLFSQHYLFLMVFIIGLGYNKLTTFFGTSRFFERWGLVTLFAIFLLAELFNNVIMFYKFKELAFYYYGR